MPVDMICSFKRINMATEIALQLYTLRDYLKTPADIIATLKRVRKIGYQAVQASGVGEMDPKELAKVYLNEGLTCCATHVGLETLRDNRQQIVDNHQLWNCNLTAIGGWGWQDVDGPAWEKFAVDYSAIAAEYKSAGIAVGYHNHSHEMIKYAGQTALDILLEHCSQDVWMEIDTYWITHGGGDPAQWIDKCAGRIPAIHLKDMGMGTNHKQQMREVGEGNLNFAAIIAAARRAGTQWFIIEQDDCNGDDPFVCIERSLNNLHAMGLK
jgi:sugar phosphate isomerase/epimerase